MSACAIPRTDGLEFMGQSWDKLDAPAEATKADGYCGEPNPEVDEKHTIGAFKRRSLPQAYVKGGAGIEADAKSAGGFGKDSGTNENAYAAARVRYGNFKGQKRLDDGEGANPYMRSRLDGYQTQAGPFAIQAWHYEWAREVWRVLKPGGYLLAFSGSRTWHRLACAVEDAGFEIRDSILAWLYGCLTDDAEILTPTGWRRGAEVTVGDPVMAWDPATGAIAAAPALETFAAPYDGPMVRLVNDNTDQLLTPNHRVYHRPRRRKQTDGVRSVWYDAQWEVVEAAAIPKQIGVQLPVAGIHSGEGVGGETWAALLGWVWTEGGFDRDGYGVRIHQSSVNPENIDAIGALLEACGAPAKHYRRERDYRGRGYTEHTWFISGETALRIRSDLPGKRPTWDLLWRMTAAEKESFLAAAMAGDGSGMAFFQKSPECLEWFQVLCHVTGRQGRVNMAKRCVAIHANPKTELQSRHMKRCPAEYSGTVWCVRVATGAFVARRNGRVFITGNSGFPKSHNVGKALAAANHPRAEECEGLGTALKPGWEPVLVARKALEGTVAQNVLKHGTGALNIAACRLGNDPVKTNGWKCGGEQVYGEGCGFTSEGYQGNVHLGRWPPNVALCHHPLCELVGEARVKAIGGGTGEASQKRGDGATDWTPANTGPKGDADGYETVEAWDCHPNCVVAALDAQAGNRPSSQVLAEPVRYGEGSGDWGSMGNQKNSGYGDRGGPSRFYYCPKAHTRERWFYCHPCQAAYPEAERKSHAHDRSGWKHVEAHPTVKPLQLMRWLVRLVTPPGGTVLDPFLGTGSTAEAAMLEGVGFIGIEKSPIYAAIARARIARRHAIMVAEWKKAQATPRLLEV